MYSETALLLGKQPCSTALQPFPHIACSLPHPSLKQQENYNLDNISNILIAHLILSCSNESHCGFSKNVLHRVFLSERYIITKLIVFRLIISRLIVFRVIMSRLIVFRLWVQNHCHL